MMYQEVMTTLLDFYNHNAEERDQGKVATWKVAERQHFLELLHKEQKQRLLEIGAGPGRDGKFFQDNGLAVVCTDLSPEMVKRCQEKGLTAYTMDFLHLDFPAGSFDALYALNCLLHVPNADLPNVLASLQRLLKPGGLFYMGVYGGLEREGIWPDDPQTVKRFFAYRNDEHIQKIVKAFFELVSFKAVEMKGEREADFHFQSMILRRN